MAQEQLLDYLKEKTKGKLLMSPEQLADEIGITTKQQSKLRKENKFPIPHKNIGRLVYYSIYHVAEFLLTGETSSNDETIQEQPKENSSIEIPRIKKKKTSNVQDLSHIFMLRAFATSLEQRATTMLQLSEFLHNYANKKELKDSFELKYAEKGIKTKVVKE